VSLRIGGLDLQLLKILTQTEHEMKIGDSPFCTLDFVCLFCTVIDLCDPCIDTRYQNKSMYKRFFTNSASIRVCGCLLFSCSFVIRWFD